ncbi:hypothetical protein E2C01_062848 [Portunus trituberculatus]|uniref:Uncharacterized protein n=1 Tax=Portunus trituberculatus TaxID=210409 RepID=A0A5B7HGK3_PORTR|nr:hypothetical protein [Portunus trituberculatus]
MADLSYETSSSVLSRKEDFPPQVPPTAVSCSRSSSEGRISAAYDSLVMSRTISDSDLDYIPNVFENYLDNSVPEVRQIPPSRWFVVYYRNERGNFMHASRYLSKEDRHDSLGELEKIR